MLSNSTLLITGGTGSFGQWFVPETLDKFNLNRLIVFSRDEMKQWEMREKYKDRNELEFVIGDVRDRDRLFNVLRNVDYVVHAAATKIVPTAEYNPAECIKTNINGAMNLVDACRTNGIKKVVGLSTDKACNPVNLYGASKLAADKLFIASNIAKRYEDTQFSVVRYGNVIGSRGSIIPFFLSLRHTGSFPITDRRMSRFMITLDQAVESVWHAFEEMKGGEIFVPKLPSIKITDLATSIDSSASHEFIGIRPGEKLHEQMVVLEDAATTYEYEEFYKILPKLYDWSSDVERIGLGEKVAEDFVYSSENNKVWLTVDDMRSLLQGQFEI